MTIGALFEDFFPMEIPPGNHSTMDNWRKMAQLWCADGVVLPHLSGSPQEPNALQVWAWDGSWIGGTWNATVAPGACWVNGFYGWNEDHRNVVAVGSGLLVARYDPVAQTVALVHRPGVGIGGEVKDPTGWWEVPLAYMNAEAPQIVDLRRYVPLADLTPGIPEIPAWVPRGLMPPASWGWAFGPAGQWDVGQGTTDLLVIYPGTVGFFTPGRSYRITALAAPQRIQDGTGTPNYNLDFFVQDDRGLLYNEVILRWNQGVQTSATSGSAWSGQVVIQGAQRNLAAGLRIAIHNAGHVVRFPVGSLVLACEDVGA